MYNVSCALLKEKAAGFHGHVSLYCHQKMPLNLEKLYCTDKLCKLQLTSIGVCQKSYGDKMVLISWSLWTCFRVSFLTKFLFIKLTWYTRSLKVWRWKNDLRYDLRYDSYHFQNCDIWYGIISLLQRWSGYDLILKKSWYDPSLRHSVSFFNKICLNFGKSSKK